MAFPQGINFRQTLAYVTDGPDESYVAGAAGGPTYPVTTAQGNTVGWESTVSLNLRNRTTGNDRRLAGVQFANGTPLDFRFDLPAPGSYNIRCAAGDAGGVNNTQITLLDDASVLATLASGTNGATNNFRDATNTQLTAAAWPGSNTAITQTFSTTICRFRLAGVTSNTIAHAYVEAAGGGGPASYSYTASGGMVLSGVATKVRGRVKTASGGIQTSGAASITRKANRTTAGGLQLSGAATATRRRSIATVGGLALSGAASITRRAARAAAGGIQLAGAAAISFGSAVQTRIVAPTGGVLLAGAAAIRRSIRKLASGGLMLGGSAQIAQSGTDTHPAPFNASTIMRFAPVNRSVAASETSISATGGMRDSLSASTIIQFAPLNRSATMSNAALNLTANLL